MGVLSSSQIAMACVQLKQHQLSCSPPLHSRYLILRRPARFYLCRRHSHSSCLVRAAQGDGGPGDSESKEVLDAFFLGRAVAEAVTERLGTVVGEFLSDIGRWQAEQQKQVRDFQEEVQERAKRAKVKALQEARSSQYKEEKNMSTNGASSSSSPTLEPNTKTVPPL